jgi:hypothetical protein
MSTFSVLYCTYLFSCWKGFFTQIVPSPKLCCHLFLSPKGCCEQIVSFQKFVKLFLVQEFLHHKCCSQGFFCLADVFSSPKNVDSLSRLRSVLRSECSGLQGFCNCFFVLQRFLSDEFSRFNRFCVFHVLNRICWLLCNMFLVLQVLFLVITLAVVPSQILLHV